MRKATGLWILGIILWLGICAPMAAEESPSFVFRLTVDDQSELQIVPEEILTVKAVLHRTDQELTYPMYAMQAEIVYDDTLLKPVQGSCTTAEGVQTKDIRLADGGRAIYMNYVSAGEGTEWSASQILGTFQMEVLSKTGTIPLRVQNYKVVGKDGSFTYPSSAEDVTMKVIGETETEEETESQTEYETEELSESVDDAGVEDGRFSLDQLKDLLHRYPWLPIIPCVIFLLLLILILMRRRKCRILFETNGGTPVEALVVRRNQNPGRLPVPVRSNSVFGGWYKDPKLTRPWYEEVDQVRKRKTRLYAKWK